MFKLENYSLKRRMQLIAMFGIASVFLIIGLGLYFASLGMSSVSEFKWVIGTGIVIGIIQYAIATHIGNFGLSRANTLVGAIQNIKKGDLTQSVTIPGKNDFSWMASELDSARKNVSKLVQTLVDEVSQLESATDNVTAINQQTVDGVLQQQVEINQVASAMNTMTGSVQEVARTATMTADAASNANNEAQSGKQVVSEAVSSINTLAGEVERAADTLGNLEADIGNIGAIVDVIRGITEQTNLLALNAAIEAARAGEHGRGFAVVADEVRTLASRTQSSTHEIEEMVGRLQSGANAAVNVMNDGRESAKLSVIKAASAGEALDSITAMITKMDEMSGAISSAANEQTAVAEEINRGITTISEISERTAEGAKGSSDAVGAVSILSHELQEAASYFKV